jgi:hypothetical protein
MTKLNAIVPNTIVTNEDRSEITENLRSFDSIPPEGEIRTLEWQNERLGQYKVVRVISSGDTITIINRKI